jgi:hypothetical protein
MLMALGDVEEENLCIGVEKKGYYACQFQNRLAILGYKTTLPITLVQFESKFLSLDHYMDVICHY